MIDRRFFPAINIVSCGPFYGDKCFDTQEKSVPNNKVKKTHNKSSKNTQTGNTIKTKGLGLVLRLGSE